MTSYARWEISLIVVVGVVVTSAVALHVGWWGLLPAVVALALLSFYRDPPRRIPQDARVLVAPADGKIVEISRNVDDGAGGRLLRIMIFLSVLNVHVNRSPCGGRVREVQYRPGRFMSALNPKADTENEANALTIEPAAPLPGPVRVRQIAGVLARRIVCVAQPGDELAAGQRFGMIKLGSRTELCVPEDPKWTVCVAVGQPVRGGRDVVLRLEDA